MADKQELLEALAPVLRVVQALDFQDPQAEARLARELPLDGPELTRLRALTREGVAAQWLCDRENAGVRFSRVRKAEGPGLSVDAVHMSTAGGAHLHPNGEVSIAFAVEGAPRFDGRPEGWTVYGPNSWHVPTVEGGVMDILYFLPGGAMTFGPRPEGAAGVGLQRG